MKLGGKAHGIGAFFMRFADCITIWRASCGYATPDGDYVEGKRAPVETKGLITDVRRRTRQGVEGEYVEGSLNFRVSGRAYESNEDDIGAADIIQHEGSFWKVMGTERCGCDTVGSAILLSDDQCYDFGIRCK